MKLTLLAMKLTPLVMKLTPMKLTPMAMGWPQGWLQGGQKIYSTIFQGYSRGNSRGILGYSRGKPKRKEQVIFSRQSHIKAIALEHITLITLVKF